MPKRILLVDASHAQREALEMATDPSAWTVVPVSDALGARSALARWHFEIAVCDASIPGLDGFDLAPQLIRQQPHLAVLLACEDELPERFELAARMRATALVRRPLDACEIRFALDAAESRAELISRAALLEHDLMRAVGDKPIIGASQPMIDLLEEMEGAAGFKTPTVLNGERGTHREVLARAIHAQSVRRASPFVAVRCGGDDEATIEARLFGEADSGRHPGQIAAADGGTLFIDDVVALSTSSQERLLRLIELDEVLPVGADKPLGVDVRVLVASTFSRSEINDADLLSPELAERLFGVVLEVPALRDRASDVPLLVDHLVARFRGELGVDVVSVSQTAMDRLSHYAWPGNLRELENVIERAMLLAQTDRISLSDLPPAVTTALPGTKVVSGIDFSLRRARRSVEADMIRRALCQTDGNRTRAARLLEISHRALLYKIKEYGLRD